MPIVITLSAITLRAGTLGVFMTMSASTLGVFMTLSAKSRRIVVFLPLGSFIEYLTE